MGLRRRVRERVSSPVVGNLSFAPQLTAPNQVDRAGGNGSGIARRVAIAAPCIALAPAIASLGLDAIHNLHRIVIVGCGSQYHAALLGRCAIEEWAQVPCEPIRTEEWLDRSPLVQPNDLVVAISGSAGEADAVASLRAARARSAYTIAITTRGRRAVARSLDQLLATIAPPHDAAEAPWIFTGQARVLYELALGLSRARGTLDEKQISDLLIQLEAFEATFESLLASDDAVSEIAEQHSDKPLVVYTGRNLGLPIALEGAFELSNASDVAAAACSPSEMTRGLARLVDEATPVIVVAPCGRGRDRLVADIQEIKARRSSVIAIVAEDDRTIEHLVDYVVHVPSGHPLIQALFAIAPLHVFARRLGDLRRLNLGAAGGRDDSPATQAVEAERSRLARELHDGPAQELALIARTANSIAERIGDPRVIRIAAAAERGLEACRQMVSDLRSSHDVTLDVALESLVRTLAADAAAEIEFDLGSAVTLTPRAQKAALAVVREAVLNATLHSCAKTIRVHLSNRDGVRLSVRDDGVGFDPAKTANGRFGLTGMRERARLVGAELLLMSAPGAGTQVELRFG